MKRRDFIRNTALALPLLASSPLKAFELMPPKGFVLRSGESRFGVPTPFKGVNPNDLKLSSKDTGGKVSAFEYVGVQKTGPSLHVHLHQEEMFYVVEGEYLFQLGEEKAMLSAGDLIFLPRNIQHTWVQTSEKGKLFYLLQPAGKMEEFFLKMTEIGGKATPEEWDKINAESGIYPRGGNLDPLAKHVISTKLSNGFIIRSGQDRNNETIKLNGLSPNDLKVSGKDTQGELALFLYTGREKGGPPLHVHPDQDEVFYITQGEYLFQLGEERFSLHPGDMIFLPRGVPHAFAQLSEQGQMLFFFTPAGKMEDFFRVLGNIQGAPSPEAGAKLFEDHDMKVVGPPLRY